MNLSPPAISSSSSVSAMPDPAQAPRAFLEHLFQAAVARALPLQSMAAFLPTPPKGRTLVLGAGKAGGSDKPVEVVDIAPTLARLLRVPAPSSSEGVLLPLP